MQSLWIIVIFPLIGWRIYSLTCRLSQEAGKGWGRGEGLENKGGGGGRNEGGPSVVVNFGQIGRFFSKYIKVINALLKKLLLNVKIDIFKLIEFCMKYIVSIVKPDLYRKFQQSKQFKRWKFLPWKLRDDLNVDWLSEKAEWMECGVGTQGMEENKD